MRNVNIESDIVSFSTDSLYKILDIVTKANREKIELSVALIKSLADKIVEQDNTIEAQKKVIQGYQGVIELNQNILKDPDLSFYGDWLDQHNSRHGLGSDFTS